MPAQNPSAAAVRRSAPALLAWYGENARALPWRIRPHERARGAAPDPYRIWLSEIMLQQTTVASVGARYLAFIDRWPDLRALASAPLDDVLAAWAGLGYYARARNLHKCARAVIDDHDGIFPHTEEKLRTLPGIGDYTAAAIAAIAFDQRAVVVDGNIERVMARLFAIKTPLPSGKPHLREAAASIWPAARSGDFAQALMDLGAMICTPKRPSCAECPLRSPCKARKTGAPDGYPRRAAKKQRPTRFGAGFALFAADGLVLVERRPEKGLLGAMLGLPTSDWAELRNGEPLVGAPPAAEWRHAGRARHTFTHFHLELDVYVGDARRRRPAAGELWVDAHAVRLPTVMRKALDLALELRNGLV